MLNPHTHSSYKHCLVGSELPFIVGLTLCMIPDRPKVSSKLPAHVDIEKNLETKEVKMNQCCWTPARAAISGLILGIRAQGILTTVV